MSSFLFTIAVADDGGPGIHTPVLISFINVGERISNSAGQFFFWGGGGGANVDENSGIFTIFF